MVKSALILKLLLLSKYSINALGCKGCYQCQKLNLKDMLPKMVENLKYQKKSLAHFNLSIKSHWAVDEGLGNPLIQNTMARTRFVEILRNIHFTDNLQKLPSKDSIKYDHAWKMRPLFNLLQKHFQATLELEPHQAIDEHMCKFKGKSLMRQYMMNKPIKWRFKFCF